MNDEYSIDLSVHGIEMVDVEIQPVIAAINALPFVKRTVYSCAGYGQAGNAPRNPADHPPDDPTGHKAWESGYVTIEYLDETDLYRISASLDLRWFHGNMAWVCDSVQRSRKPDQERVWSYYIGPGTDDRLAVKWAEVLAVVRSVR